MKYQILPVMNPYQVEKLYSQMFHLFGNQYHPYNQVLLQISLKFRGLINIAIDEHAEQVGHIIYLPFNELGYQRMISPDFSEEDITLEDIFDPGRDEKIYIFVYSIYSQSFKLTKKLIEYTMKPVEKLRSKCSEDSLIFAEVVSKQGSLIAKRMSLEEYYRYTFEDEELVLYKSDLDTYLSVNMPS